MRAVVGVPNNIGGATRVALAKPSFLRQIRNHKLVKGDYSKCLCCLQTSDKKGKSCCTIVDRVKRFIVNIVKLNGV